MGSTKGVIYANRMISYIGVMTTRSTTPLKGSTALGTPPARHHILYRPLHLLGAALRAIRVFAETTFRVVVIGPDGIGR
jgi:hypothetical protein